jgi:RHS repeat-associated protein
VGYNDSVASGIRYTLRGLFGQVLREYFELNGSWSWVKDHVWAGGELIATVEPTGTKHLHRDHLGSVRVETSATGAVVATHSYWPFGEEMTVTSSSERYRFAGHERDQRTGYDFMHARYYAPMAGRFFSVDPGRDYDFSHPQSFNLYAYVRNNPVNAVDPTGRYSWARSTSSLSSTETYGGWESVLGFGDTLFFRTMPQEAPGGGGGASAGTGSNQTNTSSTPENRRLTYAEVAEIVKENNQSGQADEVILAIAWMESSFDPGAHRPNPEKETARGLMGVTKAAAQDVGANYERLFDPVENVKAGSACLRLRTSWAKGNVEKALAGYGTGPNYAQAILRCAECLKASAGEPMTCLVQLHP